MTRPDCSCDYRCDCLCIGSSCVYRRTRHRKSSSRSAAGLRFCGGVISADWSRLFRGLPKPLPCLMTLIEISRKMANKQKYTFKVVAVIFMALTIMLSLPFAVLPLALANNKTPSFWLGVLHNQVMPIMREIDVRNPYRKLWVRYSAWLCSSNKDRCTAFDN